MDKSESQEMKADLDRIVAMLSRLGGRGYHVMESVEPYGDVEND